MPIGPTLEVQEDLQVIMSGTTDEVSEIITLNQNNVIASIDETNGELDSVLELQKDLYVITSDFNNQVYRLKDGDYGDIAVSNSGTIMTIKNMGENATVTTGTYVSKVNQDLLIKVRKASAGTITKGQVVYIIGSTGNHLTVELAKANVEATSAYTIGIAATTITGNTDGFVMQYGRLSGLSTVPTASFSDGDAIYLSETTAGGYRLGLPQAPNHGVLLGFVIRANNGNAGEIDVRIQNYQELEELSDVYVNNQAGNDFLMRNSGNTRWENITPANVQTILGINNKLNRVTTPVAKITGGGATQYGLPSGGFTSTATSSLTINSIRYIPLFIPYTLTLNTLAFAVTTAPATTSQVRFAIYNTDSEFQPTTLVSDLGIKSIANTFTGTVTYTTLGLSLTAGWYLVACNCDVTLTVRSYTSPSLIVSDTIDASPFIQRFDVSSTFGAFASTGVKWNSANKSVGGLQNIAVFQWT